MEDNESDDDSVEIMDGFTKGEGSGSAHGVGGNRVGGTSSLLVKLESDQCPKKDNGVADNLVRTNAFKSENPHFTVTFHPSYIDGKDRADLGGHKVASSIRGVPFTITRERVSKALDVPIICTPTYPYSMSHRVDDVMDVLCGRSVTWGSDQSISSSELTKLNYIFFRIACHNSFPISHIYTIPVDRCFFLYALVTNSSICFPSLFIETIVEVRRTKYKSLGLFCPILIHRVLKYLGLKNFPSQELVHIQAPKGAKFMKQRSAQKKVVDPSVGRSKTLRVRSTTGDVPDEDMHRDPTAGVAEDGNDEVDIDTADAAHIGPLPPSLHAMMETIMTTQATHGQLLHGLLAEVVALRADVTDYRRPVPPSPPSDS
nr:hypothetical protein CFP56_61275 [Quercus suber]